MIIPKGKQQRRKPAKKAGQAGGMGGLTRKQKSLPASLQKKIMASKKKKKRMA
tara:strand:+ start:97 stop:255 length:159 start_codon:yes stop_codon:yes gene_type:complete